MEKRYQVFISSTFQDLQPARQEVSHALLRADCFPAGMELFPAADEEQFEFIKRVIDESDYYLIISAGRYGSIEPNSGKSYTGLEYDYAVSVDKPIIRFLHRDPFNKLTGEYIEKTDEGRAKLLEFRNKIMANRLVCLWEYPRELGAEIILALNEIKKRKPAAGWVRANRPERNPASIRRSFPYENPSSVFESADSAFAAAVNGVQRGSVITVTVTQIEDGGVEVEYGGVKSFIRRSDLSRERSEQRPERFSVGDRINVRVTNVDSEKSRLGLSIKAREIVEEVEAQRANPKTTE